MSEIPEAMNQEEVQAITERLGKERAHQSGSGWFYWIAGLSLINSVVAWTGSSWNFLAGLGVTQVADGFSAGLATGGGPVASFAKILSIALDLGVMAFFIGLGRYARKRHTWAYVLGLALYTLDALILLPFQAWLGFAFHLWALFGIWGGYQACRWLRTQEATISEASGPATVDPA